MGWRQSNRVRNLQNKLPSFGKYIGEGEKRIVKEICFGRQENTHNSVHETTF